MKIMCQPFYVVAMLAQSASNMGRPRVRCKGGSTIAAVLQKQLESPDIDYRREFKGTLDQKGLVKYKLMIRALFSGPCPNGSIIPKVAESAARELCVLNEKKWHLAGSQEATAKKIGVQIRAMLRDVQQSVIKAKGRVYPEWLQTVLGQTSASQVAQEQDESEVDEAVVAGSEDDAEGRSEEIGSDAKPCDDEDEPAHRDREVVYFYGFDGDQQLAYRTAFGETTAAKNNGAERFEHHLVLRPMTRLKQSGTMAAHGRWQDLHAELMGWWQQDLHLHRQVRQLSRSRRWASRISQARQIGSS